MPGRGPPLTRSAALRGVATPGGAHPGLGLRGGTAWGRCPAGPASSRPPAGGKRVPDFIRLESLESRPRRRAADADSAPSAGPWGPPQTGGLSHGCAFTKPPSALRGQCTAPQGTPPGDNRISFYILHFLQLSYFLYRGETSIKPRSVTVIEGHVRSPRAARRTRAAHGRGEQVGDGQRTSRQSRRRQAMAVAGSPPVAAPRPRPLTRARSTKGHFSALRL